MNLMMCDDNGGVKLFGYQAGEVYRYYSEVTENSPAEVIENFFCKDYE